MFNVCPFGHGNARWNPEQVTEMKLNRQISHSEYLAISSAHSVQDSPCVSISGLWIPRRWLARDLASSREPTQRLLLLPLLASTVNAVNSTLSPDATQLYRDCSMCACPTDCPSASLPACLPACLRACSFMMTMISLFIFRHFIAPSVQGVVSEFFRSLVARSSLP